MNNNRLLKQSLDTIPWGLFFIWWGIMELFPSLPDGTGTLGIALILLGTNLVRVLNHMPASEFSTVLGILTLLLGGMELAGPLLNLPFDLLIFPVLLIAFGAILLARATIWPKAEA